MSQDDMHRGDPSPGEPGTPPPPPGFVPPPGYAPPGHGPHPGWGTPPGFGQAPGYGTPGYGPPPPYGPPGYAMYRRPTNTYAILALVFAFVFAPAGIVLGVMARRQIRLSGEDGDGLALAGIIVGSIACAFFALMIIVWIAALVSITGGVY